MTDQPELVVKIIGEDGAERFPDAPQPTDQPTVDAASVEEFHKKEDENERKAREVRELEAALFANIVGRRLLWSLIAPLHPFTTTFGESPVGFPDVNATFYHLGQQQAGLAMYQKWHALHPNEVAAMLRENDIRLQPPVAEKKKRRARKDS